MEVKYIKDGLVKFAGDPEQAKRFEQGGWVKEVKKEEKKKPSKKVK